MRRLAMMALTGAVLTGAACASMAGRAFQEPVVSVKDVRLQGLGLQGGSMDLVLNVYNPNRFSLDATQIRYRLDVDTVRFADGTLDRAFQVGQGDSTEVIVPVSFTYSGIGEAGRQLLNTGSVNYRVVGDVRVGTPVGPITVPYDRAGRVSAFGGVR